MPPKCNRASWTYYESLHHQLEASTDEISWPTMDSTIWLQLLGTNFSSPKMNPCLFLSLSFGNFTYEPLGSPVRSKATGKCWSFLAPLTQRWFLSIWFLAWQMFFFVFSRDPGREATKTWWKGWKTIWGRKRLETRFLNLMRVKDGTLKQLHHRHIPAPGKGCLTWFLYRVSIHHPFGFNWRPFEGAGWGMYITLFWVGVMRETCR